MSIRLLSFDIDHTLLENPEKPSPFNKVWNNFLHDNSLNPPILCFNTGRMLDDTLHLISSKILPKPQYLICGVGTTIYDFSRSHTLKEFSEILEEGWDVEKVRELMHASSYPISLQPQHFQHEYKSSWFLENATHEQISGLEKTMQEAGLEINLIYSSSLHLDVLPKWANKGNALTWLLRHLEIPPSETLVAGDSGNDSAMFQLPDIKGIVVSNAQPELYQATKYQGVYHATQPHVYGLVEGLVHYQVLPPNGKETILSIDQEELPENLAEFLEKVEHPGINSDQLEFIHLAYQKAVEALKKNITPMGFSACSLADNETQGTDENYKSVWGRDGCITSIGVLSLLHDEEVKNCVEHTLFTLLNNISPSGQIPSNVQIDTQIPDYSGVGGICSIDSGLWFIIAFYEYIRRTRNLDLLRNHMGELQKVMNWISAQDSNNDALLEIPEAGDWTDLFGRSYHILYDEVLWYRANVCFGRMLQLLGDEQRAGDYFRWAQVIKKEILLNFWPTTQKSMYQSVNFAEQQYSLGDTSYLIAQLTPFNFSWRCDILGNVLAFLYNVIDPEKATKAFRFMWGAGVNDPFPVANVYPPVHAGDPDWRPYYTVNLLNLPDHYHNGGIWPFVGGGWVRFIHKLGLKEFALNDLYKLAQLNQKGISGDWEFNEWFHGKTGRPMGKAFQAWSASEFIHACHALKITP